MVDVKVKGTKIKEKNIRNHLYELGIDKDKQDIKTLCIRKNAVNWIKTKNFGLSKDTIKRVKGATQKWTKTRKDTA